MSIKRNIEIINAKLPAGRTRLVAISKTHPVEKILEAYNTGHRLFGESKVQELCSKYEQLPRDIEWHMVGHLQTNKVKQLVTFVSLIHAVDSEKLISEINKQASRAGRIVSCLLQVHIAAEETKFGFSGGELLDLVNSGRLKRLDYIRVKGLMGMATLTEDKEKVRGEFRGLKSLFEQIKNLHIEGIEMSELSMGMSSDYEIAVEEGSTLVRIGTAVFGSR